jgi:hypothetical protein
LRLTDHWVCLTNLIHHGLLGLLGRHSAHWAAKLNLSAYRISSPRVDIRLSNSALELCHLIRRHLCKLIGGEARLSYALLLSGVKRKLTSRRGATKLINPLAHGHGWLRTIATTLILECLHHCHQPRVCLTTLLTLRRKGTKTTLVALRWRTHRHSLLHRRLLRHLLHAASRLSCSSSHDKSPLGSLIQQPYTTRCPLSHGLVCNSTGRKCE